MAPPNMAPPNMARACILRSCASALTVPNWRAIWIMAEAMGISSLATGSASSKIHCGPLFQSFCSRSLVA
eukprot:5513688-Prymnesium_polylepis.1